MTDRLFLKQDYRIRTNSKSKLTSGLSQASYSYRDRPTNIQHSKDKSERELGVTVSGHWMSTGYSNGMHNKVKPSKTSTKHMQTDRSSSKHGFAGQMSTSWCKMQNSQTTKMTERQSFTQNVSQSSDFFVKRIDFGSPVKGAECSQQ